MIDNNQPQLRVLKVSSWQTFDDNTSIENYSIEFVRRAVSPDSVDRVIDRVSAALSAIQPGLAQLGLI